MGVWKGGQDDVRKLTKAARGYHTKFHRRPVSLAIRTLMRVVDELMAVIIKRRSLGERIATKQTRFEERKIK